VLLLLASIAMADGPRRPAEYQRLSEDMARMAKVGNWSAVERSFRRLDAISQDHPFKVLVAAAYSARETGNVALVRDRLQQAAALQADEDVQNWLFSLQEKYVAVTLAADLADDMRLFPKQMPFAPEERAAVQFAMQTVEDEAMFVGLLPKGEYTFRPIDTTEGPYVLPFDLAKERHTIDLRTHKHGTARDRRKRKRLDRKRAKADAD
jgi:hypothetical protein